MNKDVSWKLPNTFLWSLLSLLCGTQVGAVDEGRGGSLSLVLLLCTFDSEEEKRLAEKALVNLSLALPMG